MKKILILHNKYQNLGGEDMVVLNESELLSKKFEVKTIYFKNDEKIKILDIFGVIFGVNLKSLIEINKEIKNFKPDIVYFHNIWYKINTFTVRKVLKQNFQVWIKLHNLRHECIQGMHFRNNDLCDKCTSFNKFPGIYFRCYHDSLIRSLLTTIFSYRYQQLLKNKKIKLITFSNFHSQRLVENKINHKNIYKINNFLVEKEIMKYQGSLPENYICFVGRASFEKGVPMIIDAYLNSSLKNFKLLIVGKINKEINVEKYKDFEDIIFLNEVQNNSVQYILKNSKALVMGSIAYEGHPVIISEAIKTKTVILLPNFSGLNELMPQHYEYFYIHNDKNSLTNSMNSLLNENKYIKNKKLIESFRKNIYYENYFFEQIEKVMYG